MKKKLICVLLSLTLILPYTSLSLAQKKTTNATVTKKTQQTLKNNSNFVKKGNAIEFTDSLGRKVVVPKNISKIAPSGYLAQIMLYSIAPDKMVGWGSTPKEKQKKYISKKYTKLPEFGAFFGKNATLNMEALMAAKPQVIIDLGEKKKNMNEGLDTIQKQTGTPTVFIEATMKSLPQSFLTLGTLLGEKEQGQRLSNYCKKALNEVSVNSKKVTNKPKIFYAEGNKGLGTFGAGSIHSETIEILGAENVAKLEKGNSSGAEVSMEQLMKWNPDVILASNQQVYKLITTDKSWSALKAVKDKKVYQIPNLPYSWVGRPPSVNRVLGMQWLGKILFPNDYKYDMVQKTQEFYKLFYHYNLSKDEAKQMLNIK